MNIYHKFLLEISKNEKTVVDKIIKKHLFDFLNTLEKNNKEQTDIKKIEDIKAYIMSRTFEQGSTPEQPESPETADRREQLSKVGELKPDVKHVEECIDMSAPGTFSYFLKEYAHGVDKGDFLLVVVIKDKAPAFGIANTYVQLNRPTEENIPMTAMGFKISMPRLNPILEKIFRGEMPVAIKIDPRVPKDCLPAGASAHGIKKPEQPKKKGDTGLYGDFMKQVKDTREAGGQWQPTSPGVAPVNPVQKESVNLFKHFLN